jgi:hypothetical protein
MRGQKNPGLKTVRLLEPRLCLTCRFGVDTTAEFNDGSVKHILRCLRLDCDNWQSRRSGPRIVRLLDSDQSAHLVDDG